MPRHTVIRSEFGRFVTKLVGDLSLEKAGAKAGLSGETIRKMKNGKVPEPETLRMFADGFKDAGADLGILRVLAGYDQPSDVVMAIALVLKANSSISDSIRKKIISSVRSILEEEEIALDNYDEEENDVALIPHKTPASI